jgi:hypothetical protein
MIAALRITDLLASNLPSDAECKDWNRRMNSWLRERGQYAGRPLSGIAKMKREAKIKARGEDLN